MDIENEISNLLFEKKYNELDEFEKKVVDIYILQNYT